MTDYMNKRVAERITLLKKKIAKLTKNIRLLENAAASIKEDSSWLITIAAQEKGYASATAKLEKAKEYRERVKHMENEIVELMAYKLTGKIGHKKSNA